MSSRRRSTTTMERRSWYVYDMGNGLLVMADVTHKAWSDAKFFNEFYDDQNVVSIGIQKTMGNLKLRAGYGYADDPLLSTVKVGSILLVSVV